MPKIAIHTADDEQSLPARWAERLDQFVDRIRTKAYELFDRDGQPYGRDLDHWLEAEKMFFKGNAELKESADAYEVQIEIPGFVAKEIEVLALPNAIFVTAETQLIEAHEEEVEQFLFRRFALAEVVDTSLITARLQKGVLHITAPKVAVSRPMMARAASA